jgi:hypothetical protein
LSVSASAIVARALELDAERALLAGVEQDEARAGEDVRLEAFDLLVEHREVGRERRPSCP